ncbi:hypothetical protein JYQ62_08875 [Nostoc sp. UHCC 0702]|nr:hypothetical protein JYQ62_08875 [Nostoc sp. UHCC 0702]
METSGMLEILVHSNNKNPNSKEQALVLPLNNVGIADIPLVGSKNAFLGEMIQQLRRKGVKVPTGFATTAYAYRTFISSAGLEVKLREIFVNLDVENLTNLRQCGKKARLLMLQTPFPQKLQQAIALAYPKPVIVRFSDFKNNEYAHLLGGKQFEPTEKNPMIGWRGLLVTTINAILLSFCLLPSALCLSL